MINNFILIRYISLKKKKNNIIKKNIKKHFEKKKKKKKMNFSFDLFVIH